MLALLSLLALCVAPSLGALDSQCTKALTMAVCSKNTVALKGWQTGTLPSYPLVAACAGGQNTIADVITACDKLTTDLKALALDTACTDSLTFATCKNAKNSLLQKEAIGDATYAITSACSTFSIAKVKEQCDKVTKAHADQTVEDGCKTTLTLAVCSPKMSGLNTAMQSNAESYGITSACSNSKNPPTKVAAECAKLMATHNKQTLETDCTGSLTVTMCSTYYATLASQEMAGNLFYAVPGSKCGNIKNPTNGVIKKCAELIAEYNKKALSAECTKSLTFALCKAHKATMEAQDNARKVKYGITGACNTGDNPIQMIQAECKKLFDKQAALPLSDTCKATLTATNCNAHKANIAAQVKAGATYYPSVTSACANENNPIGKVQEECTKKLDAQKNAELTTSCKNSITAQACKTYKATMAAQQKAGALFYGPTTPCHTVDNPIAKMITACDKSITDYNAKTLQDACKTSLTPALCQAHEATMASQNTAGTLKYGITSACNNYENPLSKVVTECTSVLTTFKGKAITDACKTALTKSFCNTYMPTMIALKNGNHLTYANPAACKNDYIGASLKQCAAVAFA